MEVRFENEVYNLELTSDRKYLHQAIEDFIEDREWTEELEHELDTLHELVSDKNYEELINGYFEYSDIVFLEVEENEMLKDALVSAGYKVETSNVSRSLYAINDNGEEVRISNHKRPAIVQNGFYIGEHEYDKEIIIKDNIVRLKVLHLNGFSKLNKPEYILG